jgi:glucosyltransferase
VKTISIVVPCFNEERALPFLFDALDQVMIPDIVFERIYVDDGSTDGTRDILEQRADAVPADRFLSLSRNFGKEAAMYAGLQAASGDYVVFMDADLQDPPERLPEMYACLQSEKADCVALRRVNRKGEPIIRSFCARRFYHMINRMSKVEVADGARDYRIMTRRMADALLEVKEYNRFSKGLFSWVGFETHWLEYENCERSAGESKWSLWKLMVYAMEGLTSFSTAPLAVASIMGFLFCFLAIVMMIVFFVKTLIWGDPVAGYPSMICIILFIGGVQLFCIGILGQYLAKTYLETKKRPIYIIKEDSGRKL